MSKRYPAEQRERAVKMVLDTSTSTTPSTAPARPSHRNSASVPSHFVCGRGKRKSMPNRPPARQPPSNNASENSNAKTEISRKPTRFSSRPRSSSRGSSSPASGRCPHLAAANSPVHRSDACTEPPGRVDLPSAHRARSTGRSTHVSQLEERSIVGTDGHRRLPHRRPARDRRDARRAVRTPQDAPPPPQEGAPRRSLHGRPTHDRRGNVRRRPRQTTQDHDPGRKELDTCPRSSRPRLHSRGSES